MSVVKSGDELVAVTLSRDEWWLVRSAVMAYRTAIDEVLAAGFSYHREQRVRILNGLSIAKARIEERLQ